MTKSLWRSKEHSDGQPKIRELLRSRCASRWFRVLSRTATVHFGLLVMLYTINGNLRISNEPGFGSIERGIEPRLSEAVFNALFTLSAVFAVVFAVYTWRTLKEPNPPEVRLPRNQWPKRARGKAFPVAIGVAYLAIAAEYYLLWPATRIPGLRFLLPPWQVTAWLMLPIPLAFAVWAFIARREEELSVLENAAPPELRLAVDLQKRAKTFQDHAKALEQAMEEAARISEQIQQGIELEQRQLSEVHEEYLQKARLRELTPEQTIAVAGLLRQQQKDSERRARRSSWIMTVISFFLGLLTQLVLTPDILSRLGL